LWKPFSIGFFKDHYISYKQDSLNKSKFDKERIIELKLQISYDIFQVVDEMGSLEVFVSSLFLIIHVKVWNYAPLQTMIRYIFIT
jgi:hypothetical protein